MKYTKSELEKAYELLIKNYCKNSFCVECPSNSYCFKTGDTTGGKERVKDYFINLSKGELI